MTAEEEVIILARLAGKSQFVAGTREMGGAMKELGYETEMAGVAMTHTARRSWLMNQALFTTHRILYGLTIATIGFGVAAFHMGFQFNSAMQTARVALQDVFPSAQALNDELDYLFNFTKYTPFQFKDVTIAFRQLYAAFQPLGISVDDTNATIKAMVDALAYAGKTTPGNLNRVAVALQHMAYQGHLTGYTVNQLARDGLPIFAILNKELGLTGEQIHKIGTLGIPTNVILQKMIDYINRTPGFQNAAYRQATQTLTGIFTTFKDNIGQLFGYIETQPFVGAQNFFNRFNGFIGDLTDKIKSGQIRSVQALLVDMFGPGAGAIWHQIATDFQMLWHAVAQIIVGFVQFKPLWIAFYAGLVLIHGILIVLNPLLDHMNIVLSIIIPLYVTYKVTTWYLVAALKAQAFWTAVNTAELKDLTFAQWLARASLYAYYFTLGRVILLMKSFRVVAATYTAAMILMAQDSWLFNFALKAYYFTLGRILLLSAAIKLFAARYVTAIVLMTINSRAFALATRAMALAQIFLRAALYQTARAFIVMTLAMLANPVGLIIAAVVLLVGGLVILYFKWKWFHNLVNDTWHFIMQNAPYVAAALTLAFGPLGAILASMILIIKYWREIKNFGQKHVVDPIRHPLRSIQDDQKHKGSFWNALITPPFSFASGGTMPWSDFAWVGEHGPELALLPGGTRVLNAGESAQYRRPGGPPGGGGSKQPLVIQLVLKQRVLEEVMVEIEGDRLARA